METVYYTQHEKKKAAAFAALNNLDPSVSSLPMDRLAALAGCGVGYVKQWLDEQRPMDQTVVRKARPIAPPKLPKSWVDNCPVEEGVVNHSVLLPLQLQWVVVRARSGLSLAQVVRAGLDRPEREILALSRGHVLPHSGMVSAHGGQIMQRMTVPLPPDVWVAVEAHGEKYRLGRSEALRELLRLGLGHPPPPPVSKDIIERRQRILDLAASKKLSLARIAAEVGVSRQRVHAVLKEARAQV
jgi:hypothetical protein